MYKKTKKVNANKTERRYVYGNKSGYECIR